MSRAAYDLSPERLADLKHRLAVATAAMNSCRTATQGMDSRFSAWCRDTVAELADFSDSLEPLPEARFEDFCVVACRRLGGLGETIGETRRARRVIADD